MCKGFPDHTALHAELLELFDEFGQFGKTAEGGLCRLAASKEDGEARDHLCAWLKDNQFDVLIDAVGNVFGIYDFGPAYPKRYFFCGSHLDSQSDGGRFDGTLGVAYACIAALYLKQAQNKETLKPGFRYFVVCNWTGEEGARFQPSLIGSSVFNKTLSIQDAWKLKDADGICLKDALEAIGYCGSDDIPDPDHYLEMHIEQGTQLEERKAQIAAVHSCWGAIKLRVEVLGQADHTGPTAMEDRRNALLAASMLITQIEEISKASTEVLYSSVGRIEVHPNSPNTVADKVELWIEFRSASTEALRIAREAFEASTQNIAHATGCQLSVTKTENRDVIHFDEKSIGCIQNAFEDTGTPYLNLNTIAGHDAIKLQSLCPSNLLFVPSKDGITHSPDEFTSNDDIRHGFDGMITALSRLMCQPQGGQISGKASQ